MATLILRPTSASSSTGWQTSGAVIAKSFDNNTGTYAQQSNQTCNATYVLDNIDAGLSGSTFNSFTISGLAKGGRRGTTSAALKLVEAGGSDVASAESESWTSSISTQTTTAVTTKADGSALDGQYINGCTLNIVPNSSGIFLYEIYVTVDYTEASGYTHNVNGVAAANIGKVNSVATANIGKIITVD